MADNDTTAARGAVRKVPKREYRQYMHRKGGFNRPLSPSVSMVFSPHFRHLHPSLPAAPRRAEAHRQPGRQEQVGCPSLSWGYAPENVDKRAEAPVVEDEHVEEAAVAREQRLYVVVEQPNLEHRRVA